jgi:hypothetical protein
VGVVNHGMDPYVVLGVDPGASPAEIDAAFARRRRLHDPATQRSETDRDAARRFQAELGDAYRALLGTAPPSQSTSTSTSTATSPGAAAAPTGTTKRPGASPGRDWLFFLGAVIAAYIVLQVPLALGLGFVGAIIGWLGAIGVMIVALAKLHGRRA